jgi:hypothetical protein
MDEDLLFSHPPPELLEQLDGQAGPPPSVLDGRLKPLPRGHTGPYTTASTAAVQPAASLDLPAIIAAVFNGIQQGSGTSHVEPRTPQRVCTHPHSYTPIGRQRDSDTAGSPSAGRGRGRRAPLSPVPAFGEELSAFLVDFAANKRMGIDGWEQILVDLDFTPDVIASEDFTAQELVDALGVPRGTALKLKLHARVWNDRLELARESL